MAIISIARLMVVLPVPVTPLSQILAILIINKPAETILNTGIPCSIKFSSWPKSAKKGTGKMLTTAHINMQAPMLQIIILLIASITLYSFFCPIKLLTILLQVAEKAHTKTPINPKMFRMVLLMALAVSSCLASIKKKKVSQVVTLITN